MNLGKHIRLNRLFAHPSGRLCSVAVDHLINYKFERLPQPLRRIRETLDQIVAGAPDAVTMHRGVAASAWMPHAGKVPLILQSALVRPDDTCHELLTSPEDAVRLGADAIAVAGFVRGATEGRFMKTVARVVRDVAPYEMPVMAHMYPRRFDGNEVAISFDPEDVAWAARCALECGADVIKTAYCNDVAAFGEIVSQTPVPIVAAGGPKKETLAEWLAMLQETVQAGARGATVGRNVWAAENITATLRAFKAVVHDDRSPAEAMEAAGLGLTA